MPCVGKEIGTLKHMKQKVCAVLSDAGMWLHGTLNLHVMKIISLSFLFSN